MTPAMRKGTMPSHVAPSKVSTSSPGGTSARTAATGTDEGDYQIKLRNLIRFLEEGDKTKVTLRFRGREMAHQEFGIKLLERVKQDLETHGVVEQFPKLEGRQMIMVLAPKKK